MNRAERRKATRGAPPQIRALAATYRCPDCLSDTSHPFEGTDGVWHINVHHDDTCPTLARLQTAGLA